MIAPAQGLLVETRKVTVMKTPLIALSALVALSGAAVAQPEQPTAEIIVGHGALASAEGLAALRAQIVDAAEDVCQVARGQELELRRERQACIAEAVAEGERQLQQKLAQAEERRFASVEPLRSAEG